MDALTEVRNEDIRLRDAGLLQSASVLVARSSVDRSSSAHSAAPVLLASSSIVPAAARGESGDLHCDHYGHDGHVEAFCYRKKKTQKAQARRSSQGTGGTSSGGYERNSASSETHEILMMLHHLATSTLSGVAGSVTRPSAPIGSATTSQSSALGPTYAPSLGIDHYYLDSDASFYMTPHSTHLSALRHSYRHCTVHTADGSPLSVVG
jgi:hypothetical protein